LKIYKIIPFVIFFSFSLLFAETYTVDSVGLGQSYDEAVNNALRDAVGQTLGSLLISETKVKNQQLIKDEIINLSTGFVKTYDVIRKEYNSQSNLYTVLVRVTVNDEKITEKLTFYSIDNVNINQQADSLRKVDEVRNVISKIKEAQKVVFGYLPSNEQEFIDKFYRFQVIGFTIDKYNAKEVNGTFKVMASINLPVWKSFLNLTNALQPFNKNATTFTWLDDYQSKSLGLDTNIPINKEYFEECFPKNNLKVLLNIGCGDKIEASSYYLIINKNSFILEKGLSLKDLDSNYSDIDYSFDHHGNSFRLGIIGNRVVIPITFRIKIPQNDDKAEVLNELKNIASFSVEPQVQNDATFLNNYDGNYYSMREFPQTGELVISLNFISNTSCLAYVDDQITTLGSSSRLSVGTHSIKIVSEEFKTFEKTIRINKQEKLSVLIKSSDLKFTKGLLQITFSKNPDLKKYQAFLNGLEVPIQDQTVKVMNGINKLSVRSDYYHPYFKLINIDSAQAKSVAINPIVESYPKKGEPALFDFVVPGKWQMENDNFWVGALMLGVEAYCLFSGMSNESQARDNYSRYTNASSASDKKAYYDSYQSNYTTYQLSYGTAIAVGLWNVWELYIKWMQNNKEVEVK